MAADTGGQAPEQTPPAAPDGPAGPGKTQDELWDECVSLQEELEREQKQKKHFKLQRDNAQRSWDNCRRNLEETKARMRGKLRLKQEAEECRRAETEEHNQKQKQLETAQYSEICGLKMAVTVTASRTQKEHVESELELQKKMHNMQADKQEKETRTKLHIGKLMLKQEVELRELKKSYKKQVTEIEAEYQNKMRIMVLGNNKETQIELDEIDKRMEEYTASVVMEHDTAWNGFSDFIKDQKKRHDSASKKYTRSGINKGMRNCTVNITAKVKGDLVTLDEDVCKEKEMLEKQLEAVNKKNVQLDRKMEATVQKNERLAESLQEIKSKLCVSHQQLVAERKAMAKNLKRGNEITERILKERRDLYLKQQQLELKHEQVQQDYDKLQKRQTEAILDMQQRSGLKDMLLEGKIKAVTEIQEKEQLKLWVALAFGQGEQAAAKNIKELFEAKDVTIKALKDDVSRDLKEYDNLVKAALDISADKWLPRGDKKFVRSDSEDNILLDRKNFEELMQELTALSENNSVRKDALGLNPAAAESRQ